MEYPPMIHRYIVITYTNWRDEVRDRLVRPIDQCFEYTSTEHHPKKQWIMTAWEPNKGYRNFAMKDISSWRPATEEDFKAREDT